MAKQNRIDALRRWDKPLIWKLILYSVWSKLYMKRKKCHNKMIPFFMFKFHYQWYLVTKLGVSESSMSHAHLLYVIDWLWKIMLSISKVYNKLASSSVIYPQFPTVPKACITPDFTNGVYLWNCKMFPIYELKFQYLNLIKLSPSQWIPLVTFIKF